MTFAICPPVSQKRMDDKYRASAVGTFTSGSDLSHARPVWFSGAIPLSVDRTVTLKLLVNEWKRQTRLVSNVKKKISHPIYRQIIDTGHESVLFLLNDLDKNGPEDWFWALTSITGENPITNDIAGNMKAMTEAWLAWGRTAGYLKD